MFGHDHKDEQNDEQSAVQPMSTQPVNHGLLGIEDDETPTSSSPVIQPSSPPVASVSSDSYGSGSVSTDSNASSASDNSGTPPVLSPVSNPVSSPATSLDTPAASITPPSTSSDNANLIDIKREALQELSPLIDHLEQSSDEKFKTTMMMIQASDNQDLIPQAFKAAKEITDDKQRAQALLDIVNEINYFTHKSED